MASLGHVGKYRTLVSRIFVVVVVAPLWLLIPIQLLTVESI